jgi:hypothetical protein
VLRAQTKGFFLPDFETSGFSARNHSRRALEI